MQQEKEGTGSVAEGLNDPPASEPGAVTQEAAVEESKNTSNNAEIYAGSGTEEHKEEESQANPIPVQETEQAKSTDPEPKQE